MEFFMLNLHIGHPSLFSISPGKNVEKIIMVDPDQGVN